MSAADDVLASIIARTRLEIGDYSEGYYVATTADGTSVRYELGVGSLQSDLTVALNGDQQDASTYTVDAVRGVVTFQDAPAAGQTVSASGTRTQFFTDEQLKVFAASALLKHTHGATVTSPSIDAFGHHQMSRVTVSLVTLPPVEVHPVALLTAYEALQVLAADASYDIDVTTAEGTILPRTERFTNISSMAQAKLDQYKEVCAQLNVGLYRVEMGTLRRISRTTNRLTPVYVPREYDDNAPPTRLIAHADVPPSLALADQGVLAIDLVVRHGAGLVQEIDTGLNLTGATVLATATTGGYPSSVVTLLTNVIDVAAGKVVITVTASQALALPAFSPWRLIVTMPDATTPIAAAGTLAVEAAA